MLRSGLNGYTARGLALRGLAALVVAGAAIATKALILESEAAPATAGATVRDFSVRSELLDQRLPVEVVVPPGAREGSRSLVVFLHGRGDDERSYLDEEMFRALGREGGRAPVVAFPRGGPDSYWHDREDGAWGSYVLDELVPRLVQRFDIEPERIAIGGISMGGFGAFDLARQRPSMFCAVAGHSPAVWEQSSDAAPGAFDDEEDFARHDVISLVGSPGSPLEDKRFWIDVGDDDPFAEADAALTEALIDGGAEGRMRTGEGGHEDSYWRSNWDRYMPFYARALKRCQREAAEQKEADEKDPKGEAGRKGEQPAGRDRSGAGAGA